MATKTTNSDTNKPVRYNHQQYETRRRVLRFLLKNIGFTVLVKLGSVEGLEHIPSQGPAILVINHIAFVDPFVVMHVIPGRNIVPMAKIESFSYPVIGILPRIWHVIPVHREEADRRAIQMALDVLHAGEIILIAPESTRSTQMHQAKEGVAYLASRSGAPMIPVALNHTPGFPTLPFTKRWQEPGVQIKFGRPLIYKPQLTRPSRDQMRLMTDEVMYKLASLLPPERRGYYHDLSKSTQETINLL